MGPSCVAEHVLVRPGEARVVLGASLELQPVVKGCWTKLSFRKLEAGGGDLTQS